LRAMAATSLSFAETHQDQLLLLARVAEQWHCRPSQLLQASTDEFQIDLACAAILWRIGNRG
jgi:hypothetical protein